MTIRITYLEWCQDCYQMHPEYDYFKSWDLAFLGAEKIRAKGLHLVEIIDTRRSR